ncbi:MAG: photosynthesis system II assembly factor Ycf48 [Cyanobacteriota bacterium]|nr:photosynthesis system II assembly factor Ycf48 [Cyanobacteriota bacterium]
MNAIVNPFVNRLKQFAVLVAAVFLCVGCRTVASLEENPWEVLSLPTEETLSDIAFTDNLQHGWSVGSNATLLETQDGGQTWEEKELDFGDEKIRFDSISFSGDEGWIVGSPAILLHTEDGGDSWFRVPLSAKLPGNPASIYALGNQSAEMTTNIGAIYRTEDGGQNWKGLVQGAIGILRNISRSNNGEYVAVSARGNFYSVWEPGSPTWTPYNRESSRRLQNMGFSPESQLWTLGRGGMLQFSDTESSEDVWQDPIYPERSNSVGFLDLAYRTPEELWIVGGSGNVVCSLDGGETWLKDNELESIPSNFNRVKFVSEDLGFILGQRGTMLRYRGNSQSA